MKMMRFDTFVFDYDTKNVIVFSNKIVLLPVRQALLLTVCRFAMGGIFSTNVDAENKTFGYHKTVCGARNPAYRKCAVSSSGFWSVEVLSVHVCSVVVRWLGGSFGFF
jgi:hypothetical protein